MQNVRLRIAVNGVFFLTVSKSGDMKLAVLVVKLPEVIEKFFPCVKLSAYRTACPVDFSSENELAVFFHYSELQQINCFKTFKRQIEWICGRLAIKKLHQQVTRNIYPCNQVLVKVNQNGAPYLPLHPQWSISISHSHSNVMGVLCTQPDVNVGIDVEKIDRTINHDFLQVAFTPQEIKAFEHLTFKKIYQNWTRKEAFLKFIQLGFRENLKSVEILNDCIYYNGKLVTNVKCFSRHLEQDYIFSLVMSDTAYTLNWKTQFLKTANLDDLACMAVV